MKAPPLYWVCLVYLIVFVAGEDYFVVTGWPLTTFPYNYVVVAGIVVPYNLATLALLFRSKLTVPIFLFAFVVAVAGEVWAIASTGLGPGVRNPEWLATRVPFVLIVIGIAYYCYRLTRRGFLR